MTNIYVNLINVVALRPHTYKKKKGRNLYTHSWNYWIDMGDSYSKYTTQELNLNFLLDTPMPPLFHCHHMVVGEVYEEKRLNAMCLQSVTSFKEDRTVH